MHLLVPRSRSSSKVKVKYKGYFFQKMAVSGAFLFHKHILLCFRCGDKWTGVRCETENSELSRKYLYFMVYFYVVSMYLHWMKICHISYFHMVLSIFSKYSYCTEKFYMLFLLKLRYKCLPLS